MLHELCAYGLNVTQDNMRQYAYNFPSRSGILYLVSIVFLEKLQLLSATVEIVDL